jgi:hypothetical protein
MDDEIGRIDWLDIRAVWKNESADFTPWLLRNVDVLRDALGGLDLVLEQAEHPVGTFSLDLIGRDLTHDVPLIVENQIESSDHRHLGQLLTYAGSTDAGTIVWITKGFSEPHRAALDWLNEQTGEGIRFFGLVVRAVRIGNSLPAPMLDVIVQPNDWQKTVRRAGPPESEERAAYRSFWGPLRERLMEEDPELLRGRAEPKSIWLTMTSPIPGTYLAGEIGSGEVRVLLDIDLGDRSRNLALLGELEHHRSLIETEIGELDFLEGKVRSKIVHRQAWEGKLLTQAGRHDEARAWFYSNMRGLRRGLESVAPLISPSYLSDGAQEVVDPGPHHDNSF